MRSKIDLNMSTADVMIAMSEGNPGGLRVLMDLVQTPNGIFHVLSLDDMNIRGPQIWVGYKDYCNQNMESFVKAIQSRDMGMVSAINKEMFMDPDYKEMAVKGGASFERAGDKRMRW